VSPRLRGADVSMNIYLLPSEAWEGPVDEEGVLPLPGVQSNLSLFACNQKQVPDSKLQSDGAMAGAGVGAAVGGGAVGGGVGPKVKPTLSKSVGDPCKLPSAFVILFGVAVFSNFAVASATVACGICS
jgi:hypothetical protein